MDKLDFINALKMKNLVNTQSTQYEWVIKNFSDKYSFNLDDGNQSYYQFCFNKNEYTKEEVKEIAYGLALFLDIPCEYN